MTASDIHSRRNVRIQELGNQYWNEIRGETPRLFDRKYRQGRLLDIIMRDESFKIDAFRFIDVLPVLQTGEAMRSHVRDCLLREQRDLPFAIRTALNLAAGGVTSGLAARMIRANVSDIARRFITESDSRKALKVLARLAEENLTFTADILGEATTSDSEAEAYLNKYLDLISLLGDAAVTWQENPILHRTASGMIPKSNISVKISALDPHIDAVDLQGSVARLKERLLPLLRLAKEKNVFINFDLEQWAAHSITYALFEEVARHPDLIDWPHIGLVIQSYLKTSQADCDRLLALSKKRGTPFTVRLVKGAYWDYEVVHARQHGFKCPVYTNKGLTDANYEMLSSRLLDNYRLLTPAFASHNLRSLIHALVIAEEKGIEKTEFEVQMLFGMAEPLRRVFAQNGYRVRIYAPIGQLLPGMAYLVRRLLENTSNSGFLRQSFHEGASIEKILAAPVLEQEPAPETTQRTTDLAPLFSNVSLLDFCEPEVRDRFSLAVASSASHLPLKIPLVLNGKEIQTDRRLSHSSPNDPGMVVTDSARADSSHVDEALRSAVRSFPPWRDLPLRSRVERIERLATLLEENRYELAGLQTHEAGKPWREADGDVAEAIDFCRYYARQALSELGQTKQGTVAGEDNILFYEGRGPTAVIAPWNFPLAILCGMTAAALVAGNPVLIKPATAGAGTGYRFFRLLLKAGFPPGIVHFLPGSGEAIGKYLVGHPAVSQIAFTGSKEVGLEIIRLAGETSPGQKEIKRVISEMGGKNAIIVDEDADPDAALKGVIISAFGYAGQKCSACSRLILVGSIHASFTERLLKACASLPLAPSSEPTCRLGPVIDQQAFVRLQELLTLPMAGARVLFKGETPEQGLFIPPTVVEVENPEHPMLQQEFFGPILTVIRADNFRQAIDIANNTEFALTGAVFSRSPSNLEMARQDFKVGNLYLNRHCTGALVGRQPFGGYGMSGIGTKAGGPGYLRLFANPRCVSENTMRSGFTPDLHL